MATLLEQVNLLRRYRRSVQANDPRLAEESLDRGFETEAVMEGAPVDATNQFELESIAMRRERPVLPIFSNVTKLVFVDKIDSEIWSERITKARSALDLRIPAVGRINLKGAAQAWVGTGWLAAEDVIVTNRHVALLFAAREGASFSFTMGVEQRISASLDFLQEIDNPAELVFEILAPLHIEDSPGPDLAFFRVRQTSGSQALARPITLAKTIRTSGNVAVIGYPAYDSRIPEPDLMRRIYGDVYDKKRLAPGAVTTVEDTRILHNCTTLGGNSGSVVLDLDSGEALGLHFSGSFLTTNYAVRADVVESRLRGILGAKPAPRAETPRPPAPPPPVAATAPPRPRPPPAGTPTATLTIPLVLNVSLSLGGAVKHAKAEVAAPPKSPEEIAPESVVADYRDRAGYRADFLGDRAKVKLPSVARDAGDVLEFQIEGRKETELRYQHFSVVMNRERRLCFFSACNIDGNQSRKSARVVWKWDPRIPKAQQIMAECYGSPPKFSRGHMTRREDPCWGAPAAAKLGNEDSMHVTNTVPQMQAFNAPIWLALEDYALSHAREDDMKISVFTGPYFDRKDSEMYGVKIPLAFWKIIAFIHDKTGRLCATAYEMDQSSTLQPEEEFVFGAFTSPQLATATQVSLASVEARSGLRFGDLSTFDPLAGVEESVGGGPAPLQMKEQIRFLP